MYKGETMILQEKIAEILPEWRERARKLNKESGDVKIDSVTIGQALGGIRNVKSLVTDISYVDPVEGIRFRGYTIPELLAKLPKPTGGEMPYVGGLYYLLLIGQIPNKRQAQEVEKEWKSRAKVPAYVFKMLRSMPAETHPMTLFSMAVLALQNESKFAHQYLEGMKRDDYWVAMLEDSLNLTAKLPEVAAFIYRLKFKNGKAIRPNRRLDWGANFAHMMGVENPEYADLSRLFFVIHSDHESGNVSAHATHLVGSALSDVYYSTSAGLNGLAGPLHGLANQESLGWLLDVYKRYGGVPSKEQLREFAIETLNSGQVIPGYGHAVLRKTDPRFTAQAEFGKAKFPKDDIFSLAMMVYEVVPQVLIEQGKAKDPWPNVDAVSGSLQYHYGVKEFDFYTVMFGVSRLLGVSANLVWARALGQPIERPKSVTLAMLEAEAAKAKAN
jgi:citrate synthase